MTPRIAALAIGIAAAILLTAGCGSPPIAAPTSTGGGQGTFKVDFRYSGKLTTDRDAIDAVLAMLQSEAKSDAARLYLSEYLMVTLNKAGTASSDGLSWYVSFGMDRKPDSDQGEKPYWEDAAWVVFKDGKVLPSTRHSGNASRIILDLRANSGS